MKKSPNFSLFSQQACERRCLFFQAALSGNLLLLLLFGLSSPNFVQAQTQGYFLSNGREVDTEKFEAEIRLMLEETGIPATSVAIIEDDEVTYAHNYGVESLLSGEAVDQYTLFEGASLTKIFLVFVANQLVDEGLLNLDKPACEYLSHPELEHDLRYKQITLRMILSHSSGIENWKSDHQRDTLEFIGEPGQGFVYSGEGYEYLARIIAHILQKPYEVYIRERVLEPLALRHTYFSFRKDPSLPDSISPDGYAIGHDNFGEPFDKWINTEAVPASSVNTTAQDLARLVIALFDQQYLSADRHREIISPVVPLIDGIPVLNMGLGLMTITHEDETIATFSGSNSGFKSQMFYSVQQHRGFVFLTNSDIGWSITARLNDLTSQLDIGLILDQFMVKQYPHPVLKLQKVFIDQQEEGLFATILQLIEQNQIEAETLNELAYLFLFYEREIAEKILQYSIQLQPNSALAYSLLGRLHYENGDYQLAYDKLIIAQSLDFKLWDIASYINTCRDKLQAARQ